MTDSKQASGDVTMDSLATDSASMGTLLPANYEDTTCYCGKERDLTVCEYQCGMCLRFYHEQCVACIQGSCLPFLTNYQFFCKRCSGQESFAKKQASPSQMCLTALANLMQQNKDEKFFSKDKVLAYIDSNWEQLTTIARKTKSTWHSSYVKTMLKESVLFVSNEDAAGEQNFGLVNQDLLKISPNCESLFRLAFAKPAEPKTVIAPEASRGRSTKRRNLGDSHTTGTKQRRGDVTSSTRLTPRGYPSEYPFNKDGYRYHLAEPDPHAPNWQVFDDSVEWAGKPIPGCLYRMYLEPRVMLSLHDRAPQLKVQDDRLSVTGEKGYSLVRATHGVKTGTWYYEVTVEDLPTDSATRIGWAQSLGNLQAPCGYDKFSYSWRSKKGTVFHQSRGKHFCAGGYAEKDVLGLLVRLPPLADPTKLTPPPYKDDPLVKFKSHFYYEEKDLVSDAEKKLTPCPGSQIVLYKNGVNEGVAFQGLFGGVYYPAVSLYKSATVSVNFGPKFKYPPKDQVHFRPMSEAAEVAYIQHVIGDILHHTENEGKPLEL